MTTENGGSPTGGNPTGSAPAGNGGANAQTMSADASFFSGLQDADNRQLVAAKGWDKSNSPDVIITSYRELESRLGKSVVIPSAEAPKEEYDKLYAAMGRPAKPDGYQFKLHPDLPQNFPYDDAFATDYRTWAHEAGLTPRQAQTIHDQFTLRAAKQMAAQIADMETKVGDAHAKIVAKWGDPESQGYKHNVAMASRALAKSGLSDTYKAAGLITQDGKIANAALAFHLATVGEGLYRDDASHGGPGALTANNPWAEGKENLSEQGRIVRENRQLAETLIKAAGKDPAKELFIRQ